MGGADGTGEGRAGSAFGLNRAISASILVYATVVTLLYLKFGTLPEVTLGVIAVLILPAAGLVLRSKEFLKSCALLIAVLLTYEALQGTAGAMVRSGSVVSLAWIDQTLVGSNFVLAVQTAFLSPITTMVSIFFYGLHVFLIMIALFLFWLKGKSVFKGYAYSMALTSYLGLITFIVLPTAPPWWSHTAKNLLNSGDKMFPTGFQDLQNLLLSGESDIFAAFPSLHAAYATLFSIFMFKLGRKYGLASIPIVGGVYFSIIYLGQHYLIDLLGGIIYAVVPAYIVQRLMTKRQGKSLAPTEGPSGDDYPHR